MAINAVYGIVGVAIIAAAVLMFTQHTTGYINPLHRPIHYVTYTFATNPLSNVQQSALVVTIDSIQYQYSQIPVYSSFQYDTRHIYSFAQYIPTMNPNATYVFSSASASGSSACGSSGSYGAYYVTQNCTITARYVLTANAMPTSAVNGTAAANTSNH